MAQAFGVLVQTNAAEVGRAIRNLAKDQIPFATAVALTRVAQDAREEVVSKMPEHFTVRSKRVLAGVKIDPARKADWPRCFSRVGTLDQFMALQVTGGVKRPQKGAAHIAVPTRLIKRTATGAVPGSKKPRRLRDRKDVFLDAQKIRQRFSARQVLDVRAANLGGVGTFYSLVREAKVPPIWPMPAEVERSAGSTYEAHFARELTAAIRSVRVQPGRFTSEQGRAAYLAKRRDYGRIGPN
jgi:hypothetical protein